MNPYASILFLLCTALLAGCNPSTDLDLAILEIEAQLNELPNIQPNMLCPTVGFGSAIFPEPEHTTWLDIILPETRRIDTLVMIPALLKSTEGELETLGFPLRFTIEAWQGETPGTQQALIKGGGWLYQPVGIYDPAEHPEELTCELELAQTLGGLRSAPVSVSLYSARNFEPSDGQDVHEGPGVIPVAKPHVHPSWADWSTKSGEHTPNVVSARFDLRSVPAGATLFLRIGNETRYQTAVVDDIKVNPPFALRNGDFETPSLNQTASNPSIAGWHHETRNGAVLHQGAYWAGLSYHSGRVLVDSSETDFPNPGAAPVVFALPPDTRATKVRIRATRLQKEVSWRKGRQGHNFALNEVLLFDGIQNVALDCRTAAADQENFPLMFSSTYAVDGYTYYPPVDPKEVSSPDIETIDKETDGFNLMFDLGRNCTLDEVRFYPVDRSPQFSHLFAMGVGFPRDISLRVSKHPDPSTARKVLELTTVHRIGSDPVMRRLNQDSGRYLWLDLSKGQYDPRTGREALGLSEIEVLQNGTNVLAAIQPQTSVGRQGKLLHLTDGRTSSGIIMPQKEWLLALQRRAMLEREKENLLAQQQGWHEKQRHLMQLLKAALLTVVVATLLITLFIRSRHRRNLRQLRERIGANLHDEVGANLSSIALSSEMLTHTEQLSSGQARQLIDDITRVAQETATEIRLLSRLLEKQGGKSNLIGQLRRVEQQMLPGLHSQSDFRAAEQFNSLTPTEKWELILFFKEALHNIVKHAHATRVTIRTHGEKKMLYLEITDNGQGFPDNAPPPVHLTKRAQKLGGNLEINSSKNVGTTLRLVIPTNRKPKK